MHACVWYSEDGNGPAEYDELRTLAKRRGSVFQAVRLVCEPDALRPRIDTPDRRALFKGSDTEGYLWHAANVELFFPPDEELLTVDTSRVSPEQAADRIRAHLALPDRRLTQPPVIEA